MPCRPEVWTSSCPGRTAPVSASPWTSPASASSGTVSRTRSARASHLGGRDQRNVGKQGGRPPYGGVGDTGHGDRAVSGEPQRRGESGADPARADDTDA